MGARRTRQSNRPEYCPVCYRRLTNRASAVSHYRRHVNAGQLETRANVFSREFKLVEGATFPDLWWRKGIPEHIANPTRVKLVPQGEASRVWQARLMRNKTGAN